MNKERLLNVAKALRESQKPEAFTMYRMFQTGVERWDGDKEVYECGTPACALGHYAARPDLQSEFGIPKAALASSILHVPTGCNLSYDDSEICQHFGITREEARRLFGEHGCARAEDAESAATYIEAFVERDGEVDDNEDEDL